MISTVHHEHINKAYPTPYSRKLNVLSESLHKTFPSFYVTMSLIHVHMFPRHIVIELSDIVIISDVNNAYSNAGFDKDDVEADTSTYTVIEDSHQETYYNVNFSPVATGIAIEELGAFVAKTAEEDFLKEYNVRSINHCLLFSGCCHSPVV